MEVDGSLPGGLLPWTPDLTSGRRRNRKPPYAKLNPTRVRLNGVALPVCICICACPLSFLTNYLQDPNIPEFAEPPETPKGDFPIPQSIEEMLHDPAVDERTRTEIQMTSKVLGAYLSQVFGVTRQLDVDNCAHKGRRTHQASLVKSEYKNIIKRDGNVVRNKINVSPSQLYSNNYIQSYHNLMTGSRARHVPLSFTY